MGQGALHECRRVSGPSAPTEDQARRLWHSHLRTQCFRRVGGTSRDEDGRQSSWTRPREPTRASHALPADWAGAVHSSRLATPALSYLCRSRSPPSTLGPSKDPGAGGQSWGLTLVWASRLLVKRTQRHLPCPPAHPGRDDGRAVNAWAPGSGPRALQALGQANSPPRPWTPRAHAALTCVALTPAVAEALEGALRPALGAHACGRARVSSTHAAHPDAGGRQPHAPGVNARRRGWTRLRTCCRQRPGGLGGRRRGHVREQGAAQVLDRRGGAQCHPKSSVSAPCPCHFSEDHTQELWSHSSCGPGGDLGPGLTWAAARTFWYKLLPWRGSGGPVKAAGRGREGQRQTPQPPGTASPAASPVRVRLLKRSLALNPAWHHFKCLLCLSPGGAPLPRAPLLLGQSLRGPRSRSSRPRRPRAGVG